MGLPADPTSPEAPDTIGGSSISDEDHALLSSLADLLCEDPPVFDVPRAQERGQALRGALWELARHRRERTMRTRPVTTGRCRYCTGHLELIAPGGLSSRARWLHSRTVRWRCWRGFGRHALPEVPVAAAR